MERFQAFKFELMPTGEHQRFMRRTAGACRFVYNKALVLQKANHENGNKYIGYVGLAKLLTAWRNGFETPWLKDAPVHSLQHALKDLDRAYRNFFDKRAAFPQFKKRGQRDSFRYPDSKQIRLEQGNGRIFLPKLGWIRYRQSRKVLGELRNVTVSHLAGKWFISIQTRREVERPVVQATSAVGIDVGIDRFATFSDGSHIEALNSFRRHEKRLARAQRCLSRKVRFSSNWEKQKGRIQRIHACIANARRDYLHKASATISQNHALVCIEDLRVRNMSKSAAGSVEKPGKNVRAKSGLNKGILDQGWAEFRRQLEYKLDWSGGWLIAVPPHHTSQTCPRCGHISADNRTTRAKFLCAVCSYENHADVVGAINILARGHRVAACGEVVPSGPSVKQEPAEATTQEMSHA
ncbi:MAG TPA: transposase [Paraburkholderia sp.]